MAKASKRKVHTISITIQLCEDEAMADVALSGAEISTVVQRARSAENETNDSEALHSHNDVSAQITKRLLPSDRVVLNALRARVPQGEQVTMLVRTRELVVECEISRRQVQICLKRLSEKGIIKRLLEDTSPGSSDGYRYQLAKDVLRR